MCAGPITELEAAVLFLLEAHGVSTAYRIRQELATSPTAHFSGSTGAVYPLIRRLQRRGYVSSRRRSRGERSSRACSVTATGRKALRKWILQPPESDLGISFDPIVTRVNMLAVASRADARRFLRESIKRLERKVEQLAPTITKLAKSTPPFGEPTGRFVVRGLRARIGFLRKLLSEMPSR
jgi:DNA-binding PadR family transcriptional regulator